MARYVAALLIIAVATQSLAAVDCNTNITISNAHDAKNLRENCKTVKGNVVFGKIEENINLDGLEEVHGDIQHSGCDPSFDRECDAKIPSPFSIESSTLNLVYGSLAFWYFQGLEKILVPNLNKINGSLSLKRLHNVTHLDFTHLQSVDYVILETQSLQELKLDGLKNFTSKYGGNVQLWDAGKIDSVDGFFKNPLDPLGDQEGIISEGDTYLDSRNAPNVKTLTFGWKRVSSLKLGGDNLTVTLGGPSSEAMEIGRLQVESGFVALERGSKLKNLTVDSFYISNHNMTEISLPFDQVTSIQISGDVLQSIQLPSQAQDWKNLSLSIYSWVTLNLSSVYDQDGKQTWFWPRGDMASMEIAANMTDEFFAPFINGTRRVTNQFHLQDRSGALNCTIFDQIKDRLPNGYQCSSRETSNEGRKYVPIALQVGMLVLTALILG